jgi:hypothetical protein
MDASVSNSLAGKRRREFPWLGTLVWRLDAKLRQRHHVREYTRNRDCMLRLETGREVERVTLSDATVLPGDRIVHLHLWNEQFPRMADHGPTLAWAKRVNRVFDSSLRELAGHLARCPELDDVVAFRILLGLGVPSQRLQLLRIMGRFGFELVPTPEPSSLMERARRLGENVLISLMVVARNPWALRRDSLWRDRVRVYLSRRKLEQRYGPGERWPTTGLLPAERDGAPT